MWPISILSVVSNILTIVSYIGHFHVTVRMLYRDIHYVVIYLLCDMQLNIYKCNNTWTIKTDCSTFRYTKACFKSLAKSSVIVSASYLLLNANHSNQGCKPVLRLCCTYWWDITKNCSYLITYMTSYTCKVWINGVTINEAQCVRLVKHEQVYMC